ncbi:MAG: hypothetical protein HY821_06120 [Acidobacteria bacterium]|nr:hypothetical protein [Acidobacteriota bacterium]
MRRSRWTGSEGRTAMLLNDQVLAIVGAQYRGLYNKMSGGSSGGRVFFWISSALWYGLMVFVAWIAATSLPEIKSVDTLEDVLSIGLLAATFFWQFVPVMMATAGMSLDLRRLMVYPVAAKRLFAVEAALRVSTGVEVLIVLGGAVVGVMRSPVAPWWGVLAFLPFVVFNLVLSAGVRDLLARLMAKRGVRELVLFGFVMLSVLPQFLVVMVPPGELTSLSGKYLSKMPEIPFPWMVTAQLVSGSALWLPLLGLMAWTALAAWFGYSQFQRGLRWDADEVRARQRASAPKSVFALAEAVYRLPGRLLKDPLGILVEKELRFLSRSPRFRLVFFMGFTLGLVLWMPMAMRGKSQGSFFSENLLVWVSLYAMLLMGEVLFWNVFGFDRTAVQAYFVFPVAMRTVLVAKNITSLFLLMVELAAAAVVTMLVQTNFQPAKVPEAFAVTLVVSLFLLGIGNLTSTSYPRAVDPSQGWKNASNGKVQGMLLMVYPVLAVPVALSYMARWALDSAWAFYGVLGCAFLVGLLFYRVALDSAVQAAHNRKEEILAALSRGEGPIT